MGGENKRKGMAFTVGFGGGRCVAHLWHGADLVHLADELTVGLEEQQQLEVQLIQPLAQFQLLEREFAWEEIVIKDHSCRTSEKSRGRKTFFFL